MNVSYADKLEELHRLRAEVRRLERQAEVEAKAMTPLSIDDEHRMVAAHSRADALYRGAGRLPAPSPEPGERPAGYERRLVDGLRIYSPRWSKARGISAMPDDAFQIAREQIYADAIENAKSYGLKARELKAIPTRSASGHESVEWVGGPEAWFGKQFAREPRRAVFADQATYSAISRDANLARVAEVVRTVRPPMQAPRAGF
jgi:hypothetical protein